MNETEIDWMPMYMMAYIHYKTFNFLSQNRLIAEAYANYVLEDLKDHIHSKVVPPFTYTSEVICVSYIEMHDLFVLSNPVYVVIWC